MEIRRRELELEREEEIEFGSGVLNFSRNIWISFLFSFQSELCMVGFVGEFKHCCVLSFLVLYID